MTPRRSFVAVHDDGDIRTITLQHAPTANALSSGMVAELSEVLRESAERSVMAVVVRAAGAAFSGGFDLRDVDAETDATLAERFVAVQTLLDEVAAAPFVSLALVDGAAVGAGADLAVACDFRVGTDAARFRFPGSRFGVALGLTRLRSCIGSERQLEAMSGRWIGAAEAENWGILTHRTSTLQEAVAKVGELAAGIAQIERGALRIALESIRAMAQPGMTTLLPSITPGLHARVSAYARR